jgi:hypothetical protein
MEVYIWGELGNPKLFEKGISGELVLARGIQTRDVPVLT